MVRRHAERFRRSFRRVGICYQDDNGTLTLIRSKPLNVPATSDECDMIVDKQNERINSDKCNEASDGLDAHLSSAVIVAPSLYASALALFASVSGLFSV